MRAPHSRARHRRAQLALTIVALAGSMAASVPASAQSKQNPPAVPWWGQPPVPPGTTTAPPTPAPPPQQAPPAAASPVIARVDGRPITQAEFDRVGQPYFRRLRGEMGAAFNAEVQKQASRNVLDELVRRELLAIEARRQNIEVTTADTDALLREDPFFLTNGKFDEARFNAFKTDPASNYRQILPRLEELAAQNKLDAALRRRFTPAPAEVREEWSRRNDEVRLDVLTLASRDLSPEPEATGQEWAAYYAAHPDEFMRRTRVRLRLVRFPLPPAADSTRAAAESRARGQALALADSLRAGTLADTSGRFTDTGLFEVPGAPIPGLGRVAGLSDTLAKLETDSTIYVVGPYVARDVVVVGTVAERRPKELPPMREVLPDVRRRADADKRRVVTESDQRAFHERNRERWRGTRIALTRVTLNTSGIEAKPPAPAEVDRWYARRGRSLFGLPDSASGWLPPLTDSLRAVASGRIAAEQRSARVAETTARLTAALRTARDPRAVARGQGAVAETLTILKGGETDSLFRAGFVDSLAAAGATPKGVFLGPRAFGVYAVLWRVDAVDTAYVPPYEAVRGRSDAAFAEERRSQDEADGRAHWERHRDAYLTPEKYALDCLPVVVAPPDSVRIPAAEVRARYDASLASYRQEEQVRARHILFMTRDAGPEVERAARASADSLLAAIRSGADDFAELAKRFSQEPGAAGSGGDLGWFGRGRMVPEFERAAFALEPGGISDVVKTTFGYHIIKLEERKAAGTRPFDEVRDEIRLQMAQAHADSNARRAATALRRRLAAGGDVTALAAPHGGVIALPPVAANDPLPGLGIAQGLAQDLPRTAASKWAAGTYRAGNRYVVVRVREVVPPRPAEFEEVKARATEDAKAAKRRERFDRRVESLRAGLVAGASLDSLGAPWGGVKDAGSVRRMSPFVPTVGNEPRLVEKAFAMKPGEVSDTLHVAQGVAWLRVKERRTGDASAFAAASGAIEDDLRRQRYESWMAGRRKAAKVEILRADLKAAATP